METEVSRNAEFSERNTLVFQTGKHRKGLVFCQVQVFGWHVLRFSEGRGERRSASGHALPVGQGEPPNPPKKGLTLH